MLFGGEGDSRDFKVRRCDFKEGLCEVSVRRWDFKKVREFRVRGFHKDCWDYGWGEVVRRCYILQISRVGQFFNFFIFSNFNKRRETQLGSNK